VHLAVPIVPHLFKSARFFLSMLLSFSSSLCWRFLLCLHVLFEGFYLFGNVGDLKNGSGVIREVCKEGKSSMA
jgi:hypothetical protein